MTRNKTELTYLRAAVQNASAIGLVIVLYDVLIGDLKGAITAIAKNDIEERSRELKHAFLVLQQLEGSLDMENGGEAATNLSRFYSTLRCNILDAHAKVSTELLSRQIQLLFEVRGAWAQVDKQGTPEPDSTISSTNPESTPLEAEGTSAELAMNWSA
jgi:flagellar secretion chaperone FliS